MLQCRHYELARPAVEKPQTQQGAIHEDCGSTKDRPSHRSSDLVGDSRHARACDSRLRAQVRVAVLRLSRSLAKAQQLWASVSRQWLPVRKRPRRTNLSAAFLLAD